MGPLPWKRMRSYLMSAACLVGGGGLYGLLFQGQALVFSAWLSLFGVGLFTCLLFCMQPQDSSRKYYLYDECGELVAGQRHDFLNHFQVIYGLLQLGKLNRAKEYVNHVIENSEGSLALMRGLPYPLDIMFWAKVMQGRHLGLTLDMELGDLPGRMEPGPSVVDFFEEFFHFVFSNAQAKGVGLIKLRLSMVGSDSLRVCASFCGDRRDKGGDGTIHGDLGRLRRAGVPLAGKVWLEEDSGVESVVALLSRGYRDDSLGCRIE